MEPMVSTKEPTGSFKNLRVPKRILSWSVRCRQKQIVHMSNKYAEYQQTLFFNAWFVKIQPLLRTTYTKLHNVHNVIFDLKKPRKTSQNKNTNITKKAGKDMNECTRTVRSLATGVDVGKLVSAGDGRVAPRGYALLTLARPPPPHGGPGPSCVRHGLTPPC